jgi:uncharacterized protein YndB with AHSA1/START domain
MKKQIKKTYEINARAALVWNALTNPDLIKKYMFGSEAISQWKEGSPLIFKGSWQGKPYTDKGTILKIVPEKLFSYTYWSSMSGKPDKPENYSVYTYDLMPHGRTTQLTIIQDDKFDNDESRNNSWAHWDQAIEGLKKIVEECCADAGK